MDFIINFVQGIVTNDYVVWATAIVTAASAIAAVTPTPKDDGYVKKAYAILDWLALNVFKAKDK